MESVAAPPSAFEREFASKRPTEVGPDSDDARKIFSLPSVIIVAAGGSVFLQPGMSTFEALLRAFRPSPPPPHFRVTDGWGAFAELRPLRDCHRGDANFGAYFVLCALDRQFRRRGTFVAGSLVLTAEDGKPLAPELIRWYWTDIMPRAKNALVVAMR